MKEEGITYIKNLVSNLSRNMNYVVYWPHVCLDIDLKHQLKSLPRLHREHWLITYTPGTRFVKIPGGFEYLYVPPFIAKRIEIDEPISFHLRTVKPPRRLLVSKYWHYKKDLIPFDTERHGELPGVLLREVPKELLSKM